MASDEVSDLQRLMDSMRFTGSTGADQIDQLAAAIQHKLNVNMGRDAYRQLAEQMLSMSINRESTTHLSPQNSPSKQQLPMWTQGGSSAFSLSHVNGQARLGETTIGGESSVSQGGFPHPKPAINSPERHRRGRSPARGSSGDSNSDAPMNIRAGFRGNSPIRHIFGGGSQKIPPSGTKQAEARPRNTSPSPLNFLRRKATKVNASSSNEEKKDNEKNDIVRPGMRDLSPGASPTRLQTQRCPSPLQQQGNTFVEPPKKSLQSTSPVRQPAVPSNSRPSTPTNMEGNSSRCSSPFAARPGLQEGEQGDSLSMSARSPVRSFPPVGPQPSNISSGMSSQHSRPGMPLGNPGYLHRRTRSGGIDTDNDSIKPIPQRAHSRSPMRRPSPTDDDGDRQPAPPRAFSVSPRGGSAAFLQPSQNNKANEEIQIPDLDGLSIPDFNPTSVPNGSQNPEAMFTPPPRSMPAPWSHGDSDDCLMTDIASDIRPTREATSLESQSQKIGRTDRGSSTLDPSDATLRLNLSPNTKNRSRVPSRQNLRRATRVFSPMDIDEPSPTPRSPLPTTNEIPQFTIGVAPVTVAPKARFARAQRPSIETKLAADIPLPRSVGNSFSSQAEHVPTDAPSAKDSSSNDTSDFVERLGFITSKREEAKQFYMNGDYRGSIASYTVAIKRYSQPPTLQSSDTLAVLLSNRAAGLLMVGAYEAAVSDCQQALWNVSPPRGVEPFTNDSGPLLKIKLYTRLARAQLKLGEHCAAADALNEAIKTAVEASAYSKANHPQVAYEQNQVTFSQMVTEATLSQSDVKRLRDACEQLSRCSKVKLKHPDDRSMYTESLSHVNMALSIASGSVNLIESKVMIMVQLKRWRELAGFCERLAAFNVGMDEVYLEDLETKNPFPGVPTAQALKVDFFGGLRDEDAATRDLKLNSRAAAEAVCRLPYSITQMYIRAMRLEERYPAADAALRALDELSRRQVDHGSRFSAQFSWIASERSKLERTKEGRELGDELFRLQEFDKAATKYAECMSIDSDGTLESTDDLNAGGRLHAVLHCNRAACLMALRLFHGAVDECTKALKIHSRYMKAILRRARCYTRLQRTQEAISEYQRWIDLVEEAKKLDYAPQSPCLFDGPQDVKPAEVTLTKKELEDLQKSRRRAEATAQDEARKQRDRERQRFMDNFSTSWRSSAGTNAQDRRDEWYSEQGGTSRRWDSFTNRGPRSSSNPRPEFGSADRGSTARSNSQGRARQETVSPRSNTADHYAILNLTPHASIDDVKRAFRKLALKYHPDKNQDDGAVDNFRRVKLAHEVLSDPVKRRQYDSELRLGRPY